MEMRLWIADELRQAVLGGSDIDVSAAPINLQFYHLIVPRQTSLAMPAFHPDTWLPCPRFHVQGEVATSGIPRCNSFSKLLL